MLRLTTNVTVVARELGAQLVGGLAHVLDRLGPVSANSAVSSSGAERHAVAARAIAPATSVAADRARRLAPRPEPRRGMKLQYLSLMTSSTPWSTHSGSM